MFFFSFFSYLVPNPISIPSTSKVSQKKVNNKNNLNKTTEINNLEESVKVINENVVVVVKEKEKEKLEILKKKPNLLLALTANKQFVGIKIDYNKPDSFENDEIRLKWDRDACNKAKDIKTKLEIGVVKVEELGDLIDYCPKITKKQEANLTNGNKKVRSSIFCCVFTKDLIFLIFSFFSFFLVSLLSQLNTSMKLETRLTELNQLIKSTVGLNKADPDICIKLLDEYKSEFFF